MKILEKCAGKINAVLSLYALGLIKTSDKKSLPNMGKALSIAHDKLYRLLTWGTTALPVLPTIQEKLVRYYAKKYNSINYLLIDETIIPKMFSSVIEGAYRWYNVILKKEQVSLCIVVVAWSNGTITIPIRFAFLHNKKIAPELYKTKSEVAQELIESVRGVVPFDYVVCDGAYGTITMMTYFIRTRIKGVVKAKSTYAVTDHYGQKCAIKYLSYLRLRKNKRSRRIRVLWHGLQIYVSIHKRRNKNGDYSLTYLMSSTPLKAEEYIKIYEQRWPIEKIFRTIKQKLGLGHCSARRFDCQSSHINYVLLSYSFLQHHAERYKHENVDVAARALRDAKTELTTSSMAAFTSIIHATA